VASSDSGLVSMVARLKSKFSMSVKCVVRRQCDCRYFYDVSAE